MSLPRKPSTSFALPLALVEEPGTCSVLRLVEACGLRHEQQVLVVDAAEPWRDGFGFLSEEGRGFPAQRSRQEPHRVFVRVALEPFEILNLRPGLLSGADQTAAARDDGRVTCRVDSGGAAEISNGRFSLKAPMEISPGLDAPGPVLGFRIGKGPWRGRSFIDSRRRVVQARGELLEEGPLRAVYRYHVELEGEGRYEAVVTVDAGALFARIDEEFQAGCGDQLVWDFTGADLPSRLCLLEIPIPARRRWRQAPSR